MPVPELRYALWELFDDFDGGGTFSTSAQPGDKWVATLTGTTPTVARVDHGESTGAYANGVAKITLSSATEVQNACLSFGNKLVYDIDRIYGMEVRWRFVGQAGSAKDAATILSFGLCSDRNDDATATVAHAMFRLDAASTSMALTLDSDDGTTDTSDIDPSVTITDSEWYRSRIMLTSGTDDVRFYNVNANTNPSASLARLSSGQQFDISAYTAGLQPFIQLQKSSDNNTDSVEFDYVQLWGRR